MKKWIAILFLTSCSSIGEINGVRIPSKQRSFDREYVVVPIILFGFGYYLGSEVIKIEK